MSLKLKKYERKSDGQIEMIGTVAQVIGKGGIIKTIRKNLKNTKVNIALVLEDSKGNSTVLPTSSQLNDLLRNKEVALSDIKFYPVYELTNEKVSEETGEMEEVVSHIIGVPQTDEAGTDEITTVTDKDVKQGIANAVSTEFELEDYISL